MATGSVVNDRDVASVARAAGLTRVGARPPLGEYLRETWQRRGFATTFAWFRLESSNADHRLGMAWLVVKPLLNVVVYGVAFGIILPSSTRPHDFIPFLVIGVFLLEFFSRAIGDGGRSITSNSSLVKSLSFPRILLPLSEIFESFYQLLAMLAIIVVAALVFGEPITPRWLIAIPALLLMTIFNTGVALIVSRLTVHFRDFSQFVPFITRLLMYTTGIFYSVEAVAKDKPTVLLIVRLNPLHDYISLVRYAFMENQPYEPIYWIAGGVGAIVVFVFGFFYFWAAEEQYGRD